MKVRTVTILLCREGTKRSMNRNEIMEEVRDIIFNELNADRMERRENWRGMEVYDPIYDRQTSIGYPFVVFVKGDEVRLSTPEEAMEYLVSTTPEEESMDDDEAEEMAEKFQKESDAVKFDPKRDL